MNLRQRWMRWIGFAAVFPWRNEKFVPGVWTPRYDRHGRIYLLIAPDDSRPAQCTKENGNG